MKARIPLSTCLLLLAGSPSAMFAADRKPGLIGIVYGDTAMKRAVSRLGVPKLDERIPNWPTQRDGAVLMRGGITAPVSGTVGFRVETAHRARLAIGGKQLLDVGPEGGKTVFNFREGRPELIVVEYIQPTVPSMVRVLWRLPGGDFEPVPASALTHDPSDLAAADAAGVKPERVDLLAIVNPDPARLASLTVWQAPEELMVEASIPSVPGFTCNSWCYEGNLEFVRCRDLGEGRLELRHKVLNTPGLVAVTIVTPGFNSIEFAAHLQREDGSAGPIPEVRPAPNLCWQLKPSPAFASEPGPYPEFFARCFIFTEKGQTFLNRTGRRKIPARPADDPVNNPPWVQIYGPASEPPQRSAPGAWADYSPDRFLVPVVGAVSRDGKYLAAIASPTGATLCQAWHDCMHINARSLGPEKEWRLKVYAMENDPAKLLEVVHADFPEIGADTAHRSW